MLDRLFGERGHAAVRALAPMGQPCGSIRSGADRAEWLQRDAAAAAAAAGSRVGTFHTASARVSARLWLVRASGFRSAAHRAAA